MGPGVRHPVRSSLLLLLLAGGLWPFALAVVHQRSPLAAVDAVLALQSLAGSATVYGLVGAAVLALAWPPFLPSVRLQLRTLLLQLQQDQRALQRALVELRHIDTAQRRLAAGRLALALDRPQLAVEQLQAALQLEPSLPRARYQLGCALMALSRRAEAAVELRAAVAAEPDQAFGDAQLQLGLCLHQLGERDEAFAVLAAHAAAHGGSRKSHYWLAVAADAIGDRAAADAALQFASAPPQPGLPWTAEDAYWRSKARVRRWRRGRS
jgi:tetratricopeptide (TPR) repeat protein